MNSIHSELEDMIKHGIIKAVSKTAGWVLSDGLDMGYSKVIGDAVHRYGYPIPCVGIAHWGQLESKRDLISARSTESHLYERIAYLRYKREGAEDTMIRLEPHHTHFLLIDDGKILEIPKTMCLFNKFLTFPCDPDQGMCSCQEKPGTVAICPILRTKLRDNFQEYGEEELGDCQAILTKIVSVLEGLSFYDQLQVDPFDGAILKALLNKNTATLRSQMELALKWERYIVRPQFNGQNPFPKYSGKSTSDWSQFIKSFW
eukprot:sb/3468491/